MCWTDTSDTITVGQVYIYETYNATSTVARTFDVSTWFSPSRTGCVISKYFVANANSSTEGSLAGVNLTVSSLSVDVMTWYNDAAIQDLENKTFWIVAQGNPAGTWKTV